MSNLDHVKRFYFSNSKWKLISLYERNSAGEQTKTTTTYSDHIYITMFAQWLQNAV